jgi:hypothetical protein
MQNSAAMAGLTAILAAGMGIAAPHVSGGTSAVSGISVTSISLPAPVSVSGGVSTPPVSRGGGAPPGPIVSSSGAPAAAPSVTDLMNLPMSTHAGAGTNPLGRREIVATNGLFGSERGTWNGALEDTAGGALIPTLPSIPRGVDISK